jgi:hypothetical protein
MQLLVVRRGCGWQVQLLCRKFSALVQPNTNHPAEYLVWEHPFTNLAVVRPDQIRARRACMRAAYRKVGEGVISLMGCRLFGCPNCDRVTSSLSPTDAVKKKLPLFLLLVALLAPPGKAGEVPAAASNSAPAEQCLSPAERSRDRPATDCQPVLYVSAFEEAREHYRHIQHETHLLELQILGYGLLIGFAGKLAGRSFLQWFGIGVALRLVVAALVIMPL